MGLLQQLRDERARVAEGRALVKEPASAWSDDQGRELADAVVDAEFLYRVVLPAEVSRRFDEAWGDLPALRRVTAMAVATLRSQELQN